MRVGQERLKREGGRREGGMIGGMIGRNDEEWYAYRIHGPDQPYRPSQQHPATPYRLKVSQKQTSDLQLARARRTHGVQAHHINPRCLNPRGRYDGSLYAGFV